MPYNNSKGSDMLEAANSWLRWGVSTQPDWTLKRKIFHTNIGALVAMLSLGMYCIPLLVLLNCGATTRLFFAESPFYVTLALVPWLNRKGHDNLARWTLAFSAIGSQLTSVFVAFGSYVNVHFYFVLFAIIPIAFFPIKQWRAIVFLLVLNTGLYVGLEYWPLAPAPEVQAWSLTALEVLRASYATSTVLTVFIFIWMVEVVAETSEAKLETISLTDHLTGLPNRRFFEVVFRQELAKSRRDQTPLTLAMLDIDHFKKINDTFGHETGDDVLQHISRQLSQAMRKSNTFARIGGEEFAVLLPNTSLPEAVEVAERMRQAVEDNRFRLRDQALDITISIGVAAVDCDKPMAHAYRTADTALYQAKREGRNRVVA